MDATNVSYFAKYCSWSTPSAGRPDPQAQDLLDAMAKRPKSDAILDDAAYVAARRAGYRARMATDDGPSGPAEPVARIDDITIDGAESKLSGRLYRPAKEDDGPLLLWFHGGGFIAGDLETHDRPLRSLANHCGCPVLSVAYRLAPEHPYPAPIEDAYAALRWAATQAQELGADPMRLVLGGDSSGATLATVAAILAKERGGPVAALQILLYPNGDLRQGGSYPSWKENDGLVIRREDTERERSMYLPGGMDRSPAHISPVLAHPEDLRGLPPALVITAEFDPLRDEGELYAARLKEAYVPVSLTRYPGMIHGFFQMAALLDAGGQVIEQIATAVTAVSASGA